MYTILDTKTNEQTGRIYKSIKTATRARDKKDSEYGAYRYRVIKL